MQCYETLALSLLLFADCRRGQADSVFDPFIIEDVLEQNEIRNLETYLRLDTAGRLALADTASRLLPRRRVAAGTGVVTPYPPG